MIWRRIKKSTPEQEDRFAKLMEEEKVGAKDYLAMVLGAFISIVLPCLLILLAFSALILWMFGAF